MPAVLISLLLWVAQGIDLAPLIRSLLDGRSAEKSAASKTIRLEDQGSHRRAGVRLLDEGDSTLLVLEFAPNQEHLLPHTVTLEVADASTTLRVLDLQLSRDRSEPEVVVMMLPPEQLDALAQAATATLTMRGWDETFTAALDDKDLARIRSFRDRRLSDGTQMP